MRWELSTFLALAAYTLSRARTWDRDVPLNRRELTTWASAAAKAPSREYLAVIAAPFAVKLRYLCGRSRLASAVWGARDVPTRRERR